MTTGNRNYQKRVFDLTYEKREPAAATLIYNWILDETGSALLDEASDYLFDEGYYAGMNADNEGLHYIKRTFDLTYSVRDNE